MFTFTSEIKMCKIHTQQQHYDSKVTMTTYKNCVNVHEHRTSYGKKNLKLMQVIECLNCSISHNLENRGKHTDSLISHVEQNFICSTKHTH